MLSVSTLFVSPEVLNLFPLNYMEPHCEKKFSFAPAFHSPIHFLKTHTTNVTKMMNKLKIGVLTLAFMAVAFAAQAQAQFGYVNAPAILAELPAVKQAEANLEALQKQLAKKLEASIEQLQKDYAALQQKVERGELAPVQQEQEGQKIQARQQELAAEEQTMMKQIEDKREELLTPIYNSLNEAIKTVAKERGYTFVFDRQVLLFAEETQDVSADVKAKLGI